MSSSRIEDRTEDFKDALESIGELEQFMMKHRKVTAFIKTYKEQIDLLKNSTTNEEANTKGWHGIKGSDASNADAVAHKHGVVCSSAASISTAVVLSNRGSTCFSACRLYFQSVGDKNDVPSVTQKARDGDEDPEWLR
ncbi:hypothetical protein Tsubulata_004649 [Turnera subulata]|uniref:Uncharacterized protein n=1 Tax=Turnera subulata TaxID=218843 RepID=A0A9Q0JMM7_9ROSI|nr:hypothetical protein Tsubulata_004649 [Turnera subulata]